MAQCVIMLLLCVAAGMLLCRGDVIADVAAAEDNDGTSSFAYKLGELDVMLEKLQAMDPELNKTGLSKHHHVSMDSAKCLPDTFVGSCGIMVGLHVPNTPNAVDVIKDAWSNPTQVNEMAVMSMIWNMKMVTLWYGKDKLKDCCKAITAFKNHDQVGYMEILKMKGADPPPVAPMVGGKKDLVDVMTAMQEGKLQTEKMDSITREGTEILHRFKALEEKIRAATKQVEDVQAAMLSARDDMEKQLKPEEKEKLAWRWTYPWNSMDDAFMGMSGGLKIVGGYAHDLFVFFEGEGRKTMTKLGAKTPEEAKTEIEKKEAAEEKVEAHGAAGRQVSLGFAVAMLSLGAAFSRV